VSERLFWKFRLYPEPGKSRLFVRAIVFRRRKDQLAFWKLMGDRIGRSAGAAHSEIERYLPSGRKDGLIGIAVFRHSTLGAGLVTHELMHAVSAWARRKRIPTASLGERGGDGIIPPNAPEERMAQAIGQMTAQFWRKAIAAGLAEPILPLVPRTP